MALESQGERAGWMEPCLAPNPPAVPALGGPDSPFCWGKPLWGTRGRSCPMAVTSLQVTVQGDRDTQDQALPCHHAGGIASPPSLGEGSESPFPMSPRPMAHPYHTPAHRCQFKATVTPSTAVLRGNRGARLGALPDGGLGAGGARPLGTCQHMAGVEGGHRWMGAHGSQPWEELRTSQGIPTSTTLGNTHAEFN